MPAQTQQVKMVVLWVDELKIAAQALKRLIDAQQEAVSDNEWINSFAMRFKRARSRYTVPTSLMQSCCSARNRSL